MNNNEIIEQEHTAQDSFLEPGLVDYLLAELNGQISLLSARKGRETLVAEWHTEAMMREIVLAVSDVPIQAPLRVSSVELW